MSDAQKKNEPASKRCKCLNACSTVCKKNPILMPLIVVWTISTLYGIYMIFHITPLMSASEIGAVVSIEQHVSSTAYNPSVVMMPAVDERRATDDILEADDEEDPEVDLEDSDEADEQEEDDETCAVKCRAVSDDIKSVVEIESFDGTITGVDDDDVVVQVKVPLDSLVFVQEHTGDERWWRGYFQCMLVHFLVAMVIINFVLTAIVSPGRVPDTPEWRPGMNAIFDAQCIGEAEDVPKVEMQKVSATPKIKANAEVTITGTGDEMILATVGNEKISQHKEFELPLSSLNGKVGVILSNPDADWEAEITDYYQVELDTKKKGNMKMVVSVHRNHFELCDVGKVKAEESIHDVKDNSTSISNRAQSTADKTDATASFDNSRSNSKENTPDERITTEEHNEKSEQSEVVQRRFCKHCEKYKPDRAHHCRKCGTCTLKMDHHCPWVDNCIGHHNHKYFILLLFYSTLALHLITWTITESLSNARSHHDWFEFLALLFAKAYSTVLAVVLTLFFGFHVYLTFVGFTTLERCEKLHKTKGRKEPNWSQGLFKNVQAVLGDIVLLWWLPVRAGQGDGMTFTRPTMEEMEEKEESEKKNL